MKIGPYGSIVRIDFMIEEPDAPPPTARAPLALFWRAKLSRPVFLGRGSRIVIEHDENGYLTLEVGPSK